MIKKDDYDLYFLNDLYDDNIITDEISSFRNRLYYDILKGKATLQNNKIKTGSVSDLKLDETLNYKYGIPAKSYHIKLNYNVVPFYSEKDFLDKYGYDSILTIYDIMDDTKIFSKTLYFFLNDFMIFDVKIVMNKHESIIFIPVTSDDTSSDIAKVSIDQLIESDPNGEWTILVDAKADYYSGYLARNLLFTDDKIYTSKLSKNKKITKREKHNHWTLYITADILSKNIMTSTDVYLDSDDNGEFFKVSPEFKNYIYQFANTMRCIIINEPDCTGKGIYLHNSGTDPIFQIPFEKHPIPIENLNVWKYDASTNRKMCPIIQHVTLDYPNIYNFTNCIGEYDLFIEWIEPKDDVSIYDSYIQDYIECYNDTYAEMKESGTLPTVIQNYQPLKDLGYSSYDYFDSSYRGDYRAWRLNKLIALLKDNPNHYNEFFNKILCNAKKYITKSFSYENDAYIYERTVMSNAEHCEDSEEHIVLFDEPHCYIETYNQFCETKPCALYINGVRKNITAVTTFGSTSYIYFPSSYIANHEVITIDMEIYSDTFEKNDFILRYMTSEIIFDKLGFKRLLTINDLMFINNDTNEILNTSDFKLTLIIDAYNVKYIGVDVVDTITAITQDTILYDNLDFLVVPTDYEFILLEDNQIYHEIGNFTSHKKILPERLKLEFRDRTYLSTKIGVINGGFYKKYVIKNFTGTEVICSNFNGIQNKNRFKIFLNGRLVNPNDYTFNFTNKYNSDVGIRFTKELSGYLFIEYSGYDEELIYNDKLSIIQSSGVIYLDHYIDIPFDLFTYRVFIDGYRVPDFCVNKLGHNSIIVIDHLPFAITDESILTIYKQVNDSDPYEFSSDLEFMSSICKNDDKFREFLLKKYNK